MMSIVTLSVVLPVYASDEIPYEIAVEVAWNSWQDECERQGGTVHTPPTFEKVSHFGTDSELPVDGYLLHARGKVRLSEQKERELGLDGEEES